MRKNYTLLTDEKRDLIYEAHKKYPNNYQVAYKLDVSPSTILRVCRTAEVVQSGDENLQKAFKESFAYIPANWDWAQRRFAPPTKEEEPVQVTGKLKSDEVTAEIRELKNMLERHLTAVNTALTTILECWGVDDNDSGRRKT